MVNLRFNLKDPQTREETGTLKETPVICVIRYKAQRLKYYTSEKINPKYWNNKKGTDKYQRAKKSFAEASEFNARLDNIATTVKNVFRKYQNENGNLAPTTETLKKLLDVEFGRTTETAKTFMSFFEEIIALSKSGVRLHPKTGRPISPNTIKTYTTTLKHLTAYQLARKQEITFNTIDLVFHSDYTDFLMNGQWQNTKTKKWEPINLSINARAKDFQIIKMILHEATYRGLNKNMAFKNPRFATIRESADNIYLNEDEIKELEDLDLTADKKLDRVRDLFLTLYYTGQRFSDYQNICNATITTNKEGEQYLAITQAKTNNSVQIPVNDKLKTIIEKYGGKLPKGYTNQKVNEYLKDIGKKLKCLQQNISIACPTQGNTKVYITTPKCEQLTTHTARRSFATNEYKAGMPIVYIMAITGHATEKSFRAYIKASSMELAQGFALTKKRNTVLKAV
jgi:integrase